MSVKQDSQQRSLWPIKLSIWWRGSVGLVFNRLVDRPTDACKFTVNRVDDSFKPSSEVKEEFGERPLVCPFVLNGCSALHSRFGRMLPPDWLIGGGVAAQT